MSLYSSASLVSRSAVSPSWKGIIVRRAYILLLPTRRFLVAWTDIEGRRRGLHFATMQRARHFRHGLAAVPALACRRVSTTLTVHAGVGAPALSRAVAPSSSRPVAVKAAARAARLATPAGAARSALSPRIVSAPAA